MTNEINVVIGSWGSYNECNERALGSKCICLNDYTDWEDILNELTKQGFELNGIDEELFVQDIEGIPTSGINWDYVNPQKLNETLYESGVLGDEYKYEIFEAFCEIETYDDWERRVEQYGSNWDTGIYLWKDYDWYDLGYEFIHEGDRDIPDWLDNYIDYKRYGEEFSYDGFHEYTNGIIEIR